MKKETVCRNSYFLKISILVLLLLAGPRLSAQKVLKLKDAIDTAEKNYPELKAKAFFTKAAEDNLKETRREHIPVLKLQEQLNYATANSVTGAYFTYGVSVSGGILPKNYNDAAFGSVSLAYFEWPIFTFGQYTAKNHIAMAQLGFARDDEANEKFQLKIQAAEAYFNLLALQKLERSAEDDLKRADTIQKLVRAGARSGLRPGVDSSFANAEVAKAKLSQLNIQKSVSDQNYMLYTILGSRLQDMQLDTGFLSRLPKDIPDSSGLNNPVLNMYNDRIQVSQNQVDYIKRSYYPKIALLGATWGRGSGMTGANPSLADKTFSDGVSMSKFDYAVGLTATFNILDYPRMHAQASAERNRTNAYMQEEEQEKLQLQNELAAATETLRLSLEQAQVAPVQLKAASDAYRQKLTLYNNGLAPLSDLTQALYNLNKAEADLAVINNTAWKALLYKASVKGDLNIILNQF